MKVVIQKGSKIESEFYIIGCLVARGSHFYPVGQPKLKFLLYSFSFMLFGNRHFLSGNLSSGTIYLRGQPVKKRMWNPEYIHQYSKLNAKQILKHFP